MALAKPVRFPALLLAAALAASPAAARRGGGGGGIGQGALIGALIGGISSVVNGGSFGEGARAGAAAAGDRGRDNDAAQAWNAGANAANQSNQGHHHGHSGGGAPSGPFGGRPKGAPEPETKPAALPPDRGGPPAAQPAAVSPVQVQAVQSALTPAQAAALHASAPPPSGTAPTGSTGEDDPQYSDQQVQDYLRQQGKGQFAPPGSGRPAPPSALASLDTPKRYQLNIPPVPPGVEVKGGQATADAQLARAKLNGDAVNSAFGTTVDLKAIQPPPSLHEADGARRLSGEVGGGRVDPRDRERALRATITAGQSRFGLKDYTGALAEAEAAIALAPNNPEGYMLYSKTLNKLGAHSKAEEMARKARRLARNDEEATAAQSELTQALLFQERVSDALAAAADAVALAQKTGSRGLEANAQFLQAAACQLKGDRACMIKSLERAAYLDAKYYEALDAAKAGKNVFDPKDAESLGLLDTVGGDEVPLPDGLGAVGGGLLAVIAALAGLAGVAWRRSRRLAAEQALAKAMGVKKDEGLLGGTYALGKPVSLEGAAEAWEAEDRSLGRKAVAVRLPDAAAAEEARRLASVHHPAVVDVFEVLESPQGRFAVRERLSGRTLRQLLAARGKLPVAEARRLLEPVCAALEAARGAGVMAGGLKLDSVMLCDEGFVKVTDLAGHPARGDVQALAACLAELVTGRPHRPDVPLAGASPELAGLLADAAAGRVPGPEAFAARLQRFGDAVHAG